MKQNCFFFYRNGKKHLTYTKKFFLSKENKYSKSLLDFGPQVGDICPLAQVHMLGREQNPSPQLFLQIAGEEHILEVNDWQ